MIRSILVFLVLTGLAGAAGAFQGLRLLEMRGPQAHAPGETKEAAGKTTVKSLAPIITNLPGGGGLWARLECALVIEGDKGLDEKAAGEISADIVAYMRTLTPAQIEGVGGLRRLREDLNERVRLRSGGKVRETLIQTLVVQ